jgi:hypothetical protein
MHHYAERMLNESHRRLAENTTLADWLAKRTGSPHNPYLRDRNEVVAITAPILEENPGNWGAIGFLNLEVPDDETSWDYLTTGISACRRNTSSSSAAP